MLYHLLTWLKETYDLPGFGVFQYLSFRAVLAAIFSLFISLLVGKYIIGFLKRKLIGESIRDVGPETHKKKAGTPTMGGVIVIAAIVLPALFWGNLNNVYIVLLIFSTLWMGLIGFLDDYIKVFKKDKKGLKGRFKIIGQVVLGLVVGITLVLNTSVRDKNPRVTLDQTIRVNEYLSQIGFQPNDRLVKVDGKKYNERPDKENPIFYQSYTVERFNIRFQEKTRKTLHIAETEKQNVASELFGYPSASFVTRTNMPFFKHFEFDYSSFLFGVKSRLGTDIVYILMCIFIVTAVSNGVNITDGLDGLAAGTSAIVALAMGIFAYFSGNIIFADYLKITYIPLSSELIIFASSLIGACVGFLWYNTHPAQVFMGDTGSLALGGALGVMALMIKKELLLPLICGVFFIESLSVIIQVSYFKYTKKKYGEGRRIFKMSPLHHHFELSGWHESKIVTRFWIITILLEILAFSTLKLR